MTCRKRSLQLARTSTRASEENELDLTAEEFFTQLA